MRQHRRALSALLVLPALLGIARADQSLRQRASWEERDAAVLAFSPDGRTLVTAGHEGTRLRDAETGRVRSILTAFPIIHGPVFSPDSRLLFAKVASDQFKPVPVFDLKVWDVATGETRDTTIHISEHINASTDHFALSADGRLLAFEDNSDRRPMQVKTSKMIMDGRHEIEFAYNANPGLPRVKIWDVSRWKETAVVDGGLHMVFSPDGKTLVTGSQNWKDPVAKVWDTATGKLRSELVGKAPWVKPMAFSPDGKFLAVGGSRDQTLWELASGEKWMIASERTSFESPVFSSDGSLLFPNGLPRESPSFNQNQAFPCYDVSVLPPRPLDLGDGQVVKSPVKPGDALLIISASARRYAAFGEVGEKGRRTVVVHDLPDRNERCRFTVIGLDEAGFSPDGRWLAVRASRVEPPATEPDGRYHRDLLVLDPASGRMHVTIPMPDQVWGGSPRWTFSPDGNLLVVTYVRRSGSEPDISERPRTVVLWDVPPL